MKVGDLVRLKESYDINLYNHLSETGIIIEIFSAYITLHNVRDIVLKKYYEVISESR